MIFTKHLLNEEMVDVEIVDKNFLISWYCPIIWYLFISLLKQFCVLLTLYDSQNIRFLLNMFSWKFQLDSWNTNHESLNRTMFECKKFLYKNLLLSLFVYCYQKHAWKVKKWKRRKHEIYECTENKI